MPEFILGVTEEEYQSAGSKFASEGEHLSEMGMPDWKVPGKTIEFPFTIVAEGADNGKEGSYFCGIDKKAIWKIKEILDAIGVAYSLQNGKPAFKSEDCVGKQFLSVWTTQIDSRKPEEGGTGSSYTKPTSALKVDTSTEDLI